MCLRSLTGRGLSATQDCFAHFKFQHKPAPMSIVHVLKGVFTIFIGSGIKIHLQAATL